MKIKERLLLGVLTLFLVNNVSIASSVEDPTKSERYAMMSNLQATFAQLEPPLFGLDARFNVKGSPVYLEYSDSVPFRLDQRDPEPVMRKGFKIFTHPTEKPSTEVGYLIVNRNHYAHFSEPTIDISWLFVNETERGKHYGSSAVRIFEGIFKHHPDKFPDVGIFCTMTNKENRVMRSILEKSDWIKVDSAPPNMIAFIKERPKKTK